MQGHQKSHSSRPEVPATGSCRSAKCHLFGVLVAVFLAVMKATAPPGYTIVRSFGSPDQSGEFPYHIFAGSDGAFYGAATLGRQWQPSPGNQWRGALFKMQPDASGYAILHQFGAGQIVS